MSPSPPATGSTSHVYGLYMRGRNSASIDTIYGSFRMSPDSVTDGAESATVSIMTRRSGTLAARMDVANGVTIGSPTGGDKGAGTLNAQAVYDDNTLLTDYVFEPDYNMLPIGEMQKFYEERLHLPTIPGREEWERRGKFSLGELASRLWETVEVQAIYIAELNRRLEALENG